MESPKEQIVTKAKELAEALKDAAYTRKEEDKKRVSTCHMELIRLCDSDSSSESSQSSK